jgi:hypothetical protein
METSPEFPIPFLKIYSQVKLAGGIHTARFAHFEIAFQELEV